MTSIHRTVLLNETIEGLDLHPGDTVIDCTFGGGGHSLEVCRRFPDARIIALDRDQGAFKKAESKFKDRNCQINFINENFGNLDKVLMNEGVAGTDGVIFDLGLSSDQLLDSGRGFSFTKDEPLLMTMKEDPAPEDLTAYDVVNTWSEESLADIIYGYGEERYARRIAKGIAERRARKEIKTTSELVEAIRESVPAAYRRGRIHFATRTFQAIRIAVNDELGELGKGLEKGFEALKRGGRMSVISFHSLEDRIAKRFFKEKEKEGKAKLVNKKPLVPGSAELQENPRARSAKLRILEKI